MLEGSTLVLIKTEATFCSLAKNFRGNQNFSWNYAITGLITSTLNPNNTFITFHPKKRRDNVENN